MNKKGISPLIGTVLLVAIVIAMILLIMPWVTNMIEDQKGKTAEASRQFDCVTSLSFELSVDSTNNVMVDNKGSVDIDSLNIRLFNADGTLTSTTPFAPTGGIASFDIADTLVDCTAGQRVEAIATITSEGKPLTCGQTPREVSC
jgi:flagellin-like protein